MNDTETIMPADLADVARDRNKNGVPKMRFIELRSCQSTETAEAVNAWISIGKEVTGYPDLTGAVWPPHLNGTRTYIGPIHYNPGGKDKKAINKDHKPLPGK